jgi:hypothetical protein
MQNENGFDIQPHQEWWREHHATDYDRVKRRCGLFMDSTVSQDLLLVDLYTI